MDVFKKRFTRYVKDGHRVPKGTPGATKVQEESRKYHGRYRDAHGKLAEPALSTDKTVARRMLADLERQVEKAKVGYVDEFADPRSAPIGEHIAAYRANLERKGVSERHLYETTRRLQAVLDGIGATTLDNIRFDAVESFLIRLEEKGASARTCNTYRTSIKAFNAWCIRTRRRGDDPLKGLEPFEGQARRVRRAFTEDEINRLLEVAERRPLQEALTVRCGMNRGELLADVGEEAMAEFKRLGWERRLMYATFLQTGLRLGELESVEVEHLDLSSDPPCIRLPGELTKNGKDANCAVSHDLAAEIAEWVKATGKRPSDNLYRVPRELVKILRRDLEAAGIPYRDARGRVLDVHALRHTKATMLAKAGVPAAQLMAEMRHGDLRTTSRYIDVSGYDRTPVLAALPKLAPRPVSDQGTRDRAMQSTAVPA